MHRVHHSILRAETNSNYGTCLSLWDRLFGTYRAQPAAGHGAMQLGIAAFRNSADQTLWPLLIQPLRQEQPAADVAKPAVEPR
jgi:sterol desaturase/sphingolipid hydroxylase (fatty acid hydroxylase superfamily)